MVERPVVNREALIRFIEVRALVGEAITSCSSIVGHSAEREALPPGTIQFYSWVAETD